ncbi:MAG TPA: DUF6788 family protein [Streptosporangiaceae bacterium]
MVPNKSDFLGLSTRDLLTRRRALARSIGDLEQVLLGSLVEQGRRCGKAGCRCASGAPEDAHGPYAYFTARRGGRGWRGMKYVPAALAGPVRACLENGERAEEVLAEISAINVELLARRALR